MAYGIWQNFSRSRKTSLTACVLSRDAYMALPKSITASLCVRWEWGGRGTFSSLFSPSFHPEPWSALSRWLCEIGKPVSFLFPLVSRSALCLGILFVIMPSGSRKSHEPRGMVQHCSFQAVALEILCHVSQEVFSGKMPAKSLLGLWEKILFSLIGWGGVG